MVFARSDWLLNQWISCTIHWFTSSSSKWATPTRVSCEQNAFSVSCRNKQRNFRTNQASCSRNTRRRHKLRSLRRSFVHFHFISVVHIWFISYIINKTVFIVLTTNMAPCHVVAMASLGEGISGHVLALILFQWPWPYIIKVLLTVLINFLHSDYGNWFLFRGWPHN